MSDQNQFQIAWMAALSMEYVSITRTQWVFLSSLLKYCMWTRIYPRKELCKFQLPLCHVPRQSHNWDSKDNRTHHRRCAWGGVKAIHGDQSYSQVRFTFHQIKWKLLDKISSALQEICSIPTVRRMRGLKTTRSPWTAGRRTTTTSRSQSRTWVVASSLTFTSEKKAFTSKTCITS